MVLDMCVFFVCLSKRVYICMCFLLFACVLLCLRVLACVYLYVCACFKENNENLFWKIQHNRIKWIH